MTGVVVPMADLLVAVMVVVVMTEDAVVVNVMSFALEKNCSASFESLSLMVTQKDCSYLLWSV